VRRYNGGVITLGPGFWVTAFALAIGLLNGGAIFLLQTDMAFKYDGEVLAIQIDPVFIVRGNDLRQPCGAQIAAATFGNVIFWSDWWPDSLYISLPPGWGTSAPPKEIVVQQTALHEYLHVRQYRAVGPLFCIVQLGVDWDGAPGTYSLQTMDILNHTMWQPPVGWPDLGNMFILKFSEHNAHTGP